MAGIYIHIPFCKQKCYYCDFYSLPGYKHKSKYIDALCKEIDMRKGFFNEQSVDTIYFGGGTPSMLYIEDINRILTTVKRTFNVSDNAEITFEANPEDMGYDFIPELLNIGVNRLSIGIQSFFDDDLLFMNRKHSSDDAVRCVERAASAGFNNISIDLIYGIQGLDIGKWEQNINRALSLPVQHISAYHLTIEPRTVFSHYLKRGIINVTEEEDSLEQFSLLIEKTEEAGFRQYETSNFAKEGFISRHNSSYWKQIPYLGFGPSAHSYSGSERMWNVRSVDEYIESVNKGTIPYTGENITPDMAYNEYVITSLRTMWGIDMNYIKQNFGDNRYTFLVNESSKFIDSRQLAIDNNKLVLTKKGQFIADNIMSDLMII